MGNSTGNAKIYWDAIWNFEQDKGLRSIQGGYVWDWMDQALVDPNNALRINCYGGDFGPESGVGDAQFCINGLIFADRTPHPGLKEMWKVQAPILFQMKGGLNLSFNDPPKRLTITNRYRFMNLDHVNITYKYMKESQNKNNNEIIQQGVYNLKNDFEHKSGDIFTPGGIYICKKTFNEMKIEIEQEMMNNDSTNTDDLYVLEISAVLKLEHRSTWKSSQHLVAFERFYLQEREEEIRTSASKPISNTSMAARVTMQEINNDVTDQMEYVIQGETYTIVFNQTNGTFIHLLDSQNNVIMNKCNHSFFRAATDNDNGGLSPELVGEGLIACLKQMDRLFGTTLSQEGITASSFHTWWREIGLNHCKTFDMKPGKKKKQIMIAFDFFFFH